MEDNMMKNTERDVRINVLHVIGTMDRGGAETFLMNVLRTIDRDRFRFVFLCFGDDPFDYEQEAISLGASIRRIPPINIKKHFIKNVTNVIKIIKEEKIDILHAHIYNNSMFSVIASRLAGVTVRIVHSHATNLDINTSPFKQLYFFLSTKIVRTLSTLRVACSAEAGRSLFGDSVFSIMHNGIILEDYYFKESARSQIRKELDIPTDAVVIGHIGRMDVLKNQIFAIDVYSEYFAINSNSYLLLVGDGELRTAYEQQAKELGVSGRVKFLGKRVDVGFLYSSMDLFIFPSLHEGLGMVLVEAQANGLSSLASDSVPKSVKLTNGVEFFSLTKGAKAWATKIHSMDLSRFDARKILEWSPYNMAIGVKEIEALYIDSTGNSNAKHKS